jgi:hypothetical protein
MTKGVVAILFLLTISAVLGNESPRRCETLLAIPNRDGTESLVLVDGSVTVRVTDVAVGASSIRLTEFRKLYTSRSDAPIQAVTASGGALLLIDDDSLFRIIGEDVPPTLLYRNKLLRGTRSVAVSGAYCLALNATGTVLFEVPLGGDGDLQSGRLPLEMTAIVADETDLFAVTADGTLSHSLLSPGNDMIEIIPDSRTQRFTAVSSIATLNGIVYSGGLRHIETLGFRKDAAAARIPAGNTQHAVGPLAVSRDHLFVLEDDDAVHIYERFVPIGLGLRNVGLDGNNDTGSLRSDGQTNLRSLVAIYSYLQEAGQLPLKTSRVESAPSVEAMLFRQRVIIPARVLHVDGELSRDDQASRTMAALFCRWNPNACPEGPSRDVLTRSVPSSMVVNIPDVQFRSDPSLGGITLSTRSLGAELRDRLSSPQERARWDNARIVGNNLDYTSTVEGAASDRRMIVATPPVPNLVPGVLLNTENGSEVIDRSCITSASPQIAMAPEHLPAILETYDIVHALPLAHDLDLGALARAGVVRAAIRYEGAHRETLTDLSAFEGAGNTCSNLHLVRSAIRADRISVRLLKSDGSQKWYSQEELRDIGFDGDVDPTATFSFAINKPLYIWYEAISPSAPNLARGRAEDVSAVKPRSRQNLLAADHGYFILPYDSWTLWIAVPRSWLREGSAFVTYIHTLARVPILPEESIGLKAMSFVMGDDQVSPGPNTTTTDDADDSVAVGNRRDLKTLDSFTDVEEHVADEVTSTIAVAESKSNVGFSHPAFFRNGTSVWKSFDEDGEPITQTYAAEPTRAKSVKTKQIELTEHGTHIAGILAAQNDSLTPGFLRNAWLTLADATSAGGLEREVRRARNATARLFNISFDWTKAKANDPSLGDINQEILRSCQDCLFIIAAGDDGKKLVSEKEFNNALPDDQRELLVAYPMIAWVRDKPDQLLGVGALETAGDRLLETPSPPGSSPKYQTNFGINYVELAAPGRDVYSTGSHSTYKPATGSSQAVPQVVAAGAMLLRSLVTAARVKARLIATADPLTGADAGRVWAGRLNIRRAVTAIDHNVIKFTNGTIAEYCFTGRGPRITTILPSFADPDPPSMESLKTHVYDILRFVASADGIHRIVYVNDERHPPRALHIVDKFESADGDIDCPSLRLLDTATSKFNVDTQLVSTCQNERWSWNDVTEYTASQTSIPIDGLVFPKGR